MLEHGFGGRVLPARRPQLQGRVVEVEIDGAVGEMQDLGNLPGRFSVSNPAQAFEFALAQLRPFLVVARYEVRLDPETGERRGGRVVHTL